MKKMLIIPLIAICLSVSAQEKIKYYRVDLHFTTTDGCFRDITDYHWGTAVSTSYDALKAGMKKWIKPYKMIDSTFIITLIKKTTKAEVTSHKGEKFKPCAPEPTFAISSINDTIQYKLRDYNWNQPAYNFNTLSGNTYYLVLNVSSPDSAKNITVTFSKSLVHFINDSTFTYKQ